MSAAACSITVSIGPMATLAAKETKGLQLGRGRGKNKAEEGGLEELTSRSELALLLRPVHDVR